MALPSAPAASHPRPRRINTPFVHLSRVHALQASGNAAIAIALADSLFFSLDPTAARSSIILYLLLSMAPFVVVAPMIGPAIDKIRGGHKLVMISLLFGMTITAFGMIGQIKTLFVFPLAFAILVFGKGYAVAKAALVPAIVRSEDELVSRNSRLAVVTGVMSFVGAVPAYLISLIGGAPWAVILGMIQFLLAALIAFNLPSARRLGKHKHLDQMPDLLADWETMQNIAAPGEPGEPGPHGPASPHGANNQDTPEDASANPFPPGTTFDNFNPSQLLVKPSRKNLGSLFRFWQRTSKNPSLKLPRIRNSAIAMLVLRGSIGFMTFFLAFHFRGGTDDVDLSGVGTAVGAGVSNVLGFDVNSQGAEPIWKLGLLVAVGVIGGMVGSFLAPRLRLANQEAHILIGSLLLVVVASFGSLLIGGLLGGSLLSFTFSFSVGSGKVAFDSIIQRLASAEDYGRSFAVFETRLQLVWVIGALMPVFFTIPFWLGCVLLFSASLAELVFYLMQRRHINRVEASSGPSPETNRLQQIHASQPQTGGG